MRKITLLFAAMVFGWTLQAQTLNQAANWPNTNWTLNVIEHTGSNAQDIEADPTADANFAYDDDDTGSGSHDVIAAESPVIDLSAAQTAGENFIKVSGEFVFRNLDNDEYLAIEYWDSDASAWTLWYQFPNQDTAGAPYDNYCSGTPVSYLSDALDISGFTATQLSGFKYRFIYNDDTTGGNGYNYGFCLSSPTIFSNSSNFTAPVFTLTSVPDCANGQFSVDVEVTDLGGASGVTVSDDQGSASQQLSATGTVTFGPYASGSTVNFTVINDDDANVFASDVVSFYCPPANDECDNATAVTVNTDDTCTNLTHGTTVSATASPQADDVTGTPNNDVWFTFTAPEASLYIKLLNVTAVVGTSTDMGMGLYSGDCANLTLVNDSDPNTMRVNGLTVGDTYYLRVYGWGSNINTTAQTEFDVCVATIPAPPANDDCANATPLTLDQGAISSFISVDNSGATFSSEPDPSCGDYSTNGLSGDVWFSVQIPAGITEVTFDVANINGLTSVAAALYSGTCGSLTEVDCTQYGLGWPWTISGLTAGDTYYLRAWDYGNNQLGTFDIGGYYDTSSIADNKIEGFKFYPNPVNHTLNLSAQENIENVNVFNIAGQEVLSIQPNATQTQINMGKLQNGIYFVKAQVNGQVTAFKVVKK